MFVYGTLKQGYHNHRNLLLGSEFVGRAVTESRFDLIDCGFPVALVPDEGGGRRVRGELYWVNDKTLSRLDRLEGEGHMYSRVTVHTSHGTAMMYVGCEAFWEEQRNLLDACHVDGDGCYDWGACTPYPMLRLSRQLRVPYGVVLTIADWARRLVILDDQSDDTTSLRLAIADAREKIKRQSYAMSFGASYFRADFASEHEVSAVGRYCGSLTDPYAPGPVIEAVIAVALTEVARRRRA